MKTTTLTRVALACTALATLASHAEGLYTYALVDGGMASTKISGASNKTEFVTGGYAPTFAGLTYEKAVNGGLTVGAKLEQGFLIAPKPDTSSRFWFGNGGFLNREANVYIKGPVGSFVVGTQPNMAFKTVLLGEPRSGSNYGSALAMIDIVGDLGTVDDAAISYTSLPLSGLTLGAQYVPQTKSSKPTCTETCSDVKSGTRLSLSYAAGPLNLGLASYSSTLFTSSSSAATTKASGSIASGSYKMGAATLKAVYASQKIEGSLATMTTSGAGGAYALTPDLTLDAGVYKSTSATGAMKVLTTGVGGQYKLTKELTIYTQLAEVHNKGGTGGSAAINFAGPTVQDLFLSPGKKASTLNAGLLYAFF